jgi:hypothetical protein
VARLGWLPLALVLLFAACGLSVQPTATPPPTVPAATSATSSGVTATTGSQGTAAPETPIPAATPTPGSTPTPVVSCPAAPTTVTEMIHVGVATAAACFGQASLTIEGFSVECGGCGGVDLYDRSPGWLAMMIPEFFVGVLPGVAGLDPTMGFAVFVNPATGISFPAPGPRVRVTGHFNDPAALTCTMTPQPGSGVSALDPNSVITTCKQSFVVTAVSEVTP